MILCYLRPSAAIIEQKIEPILQEFGEKQRALRDSLLTQLKDVLDADQFEQFQKRFVPPRPPRRESASPLASQPAP